MMTPRNLNSILISFFSAATLFSLLAILVVSGVTNAFDSAALLWIHQQSNMVLDKIFVILTQLGGVYGVTAITLLLVTFLTIKKKYSKALFLTIAVAGIALVNMIVKTLFERSRPDLWDWIITETSYSFPSGHSSASAVLALSVVLLLWKTKWRLASIIVGGAYVVIIGLSRMYLGVHFPSDVLGGWLLGVIWVSFVMACFYVARKSKGVSKGQA